MIIPLRMLWESSLIHLDWCLRDSFTLSVWAKDRGVVWKMKWPVGFHGEIWPCLSSHSAYDLFLSRVLFIFFVGRNSSVSLKGRLGSVVCELGVFYSRALNCYLTAHGRVLLILD